MDAVTSQNRPSPEALQQMLVMLSAMMSSQGQREDPMAQYLAELQRQDEERKRREEQQQNFRALSPLTNPNQGGGQGKSTGFGNLMQGYGVADDLSQAFTDKSLFSNLASLFSSL